MENELKKVFAVIDLKAFYAFVECIDRGLDPWKTSLVVADKTRGTNTIILSVTPYLKSLGIPSRLRIKELPKKYNYIYATPRMQRYIDKSAEIVSIMSEFVSYDDIHVYSIDEAFLDLSSYLKYYNMSPTEIVQMIIKEINERTGLQATAGIGDNMFLAKVALDIFAKSAPNFIAVLKKEEVQERLWPITPLSKIWSIGPRTEAKLNKLGIFNVGELANSNRDYMKSKFGIIGEQLIDLANGIDESDMHEEYIPKETSLSLGQVLFKDYNRDEVVTIIREMTDELATRLRSEGKHTSKVSLFIGYSLAEQGGFARQMSLLSPTDNTQKLFEAIMEIFNMFIQDKPIRRVSINYGKLSNPNYEQLSMFEEPEKVIAEEKLQKAIDLINSKYGKNAILRGEALTDKSTIRERHSFIGGHKK